MESGITFSNNIAKTMYKIEKFKYNGFMVQPMKGYYNFTVVSLVRWTDDPGIGLFVCSDNKKRLIPSCCITKEFLETQPKSPKLNPFEGKGVLFGTPIDYEQ